MTIKVISTIKPQGVALGVQGTFPIIEDIDILGGFQVQPTTAARDAMAANAPTNLKLGMSVYVTANNTKYILTQISPSVVWSVSENVYWGANTSSQITTVTNNYGVVNTDRIILVTSLPFGITVTLPSAPNDGQRHLVTDGTNTAGSTNFYINKGNSGQSFSNGLTQQIVNVNSGFFEFLFYNNVWHITSSSTSGAATGAAGGDLTGAYPNPTVATLTGSSGVVQVNAYQLYWPQNIGSSVFIGMSPFLSSGTAAQGANVSVFAQSTVAANSLGGSVTLVAGTGTNTSFPNLGNGTVAFQTNGSTAMSIGYRTTFNNGVNNNFISVAGNTTYTCGNSDGVLLVQSAAGPTTINLQSVYSNATAGAGLTITIKDDQGFASSNPITIRRSQTGNGGGPDPFIYGNIEGANTLVLSGAYNSVTLLLGNNGWRII